MTCTRINGAIVCETPDFKPGDLPPDGYLAWHEWAEVQHKAGLRQKQCGRCGKFKYPQELSAFIDRVAVRRGKKTVVAESAVCNECEEKGVAK